MISMHELLIIMTLVLNHKLQLQTTTKTFLGRNACDFKMDNNLVIPLFSQSTSFAVSKKNLWYFNMVYIA